MNENGAVGAGGPGGNGKPGCVSRTGLEDSINNLSMNETEEAIGISGIRVAECAIGVGGTGKPGGAGGSGGIGNPGCTNGAGCVSRTGVDGLEDFVDNLSMNETEQAIGAGGVRVAKWAKESIRAGGTEGAIVTPYSGPLFPAYSSKVSIKRTV